MIGPHRVPVNPQSELSWEKLRQILSKSVGFGLDLVRSGWISTDLEEIRPNLKEISLDLDKLDKKGRQTTCLNKERRFSGV